MIVDGDRLIAKQMELDEPAVITFSDEHSTVLQPVRDVPRLDDAAAMVSLDGDWRVKRWPFRQEEKLVAPQTRDKKWQSVTQPGVVLIADPHAEGEPIPNWNRVTQQHLDPRDGAVIRRRAVVPEDWDGKRVILRFDGIYPAGRIYLNGELLGEHLSGLTPAEYDITAKVTPGKEVLVAVRLLRRHKFVQMDMPRHASEFAGLSQSSCLYAVEPVYIKEHHLTAELDETCTKGKISGSVTLMNTTSRTGVATVSVELLDENGRVAAGKTAKTKLLVNKQRRLRLTLNVKDPLLWNDEYPNLYTVRLTLRVSRQPKQAVSYKTGFRRLDLSPRGPKLNGNFIKFRGVNHLTYHPQYGMYTPKEWLYANLRMMKKANINCIRTHFLGPRDLAEVCDELGLYLIQELPIDWGTNYIHKPEWVGPALHRIMGGIVRDRHHPSVMIWAVGNENMPESKEATEDGWNHMATYERFTKVLDPSRPNMFPPPGPANKIKGIFELRFGDVADIHYSFNLARDFLKTGKCKQPRSWDADMEVMTRKKALKRGWSGVWFSSEFGLFNMIPDLLNAPYQSIIVDFPEDPLSGLSTMQTFINRLRTEWSDLMRAEKTCLGGTFFPWICGAVGAGEEGNPWGWIRWAEDSDWGPMCADLTPKPFFWAMRALYSPVYFPARYTWKRGARTLRFQIENQYNSIDLEDCTIRTQFSSGAYMAMTRQFRDVDISCAPGKKKKVSVPVWNAGVRKTLDNGQYAICRVSLMDPKGFRVITHDILIIPENLGGAAATEMPVGPDAKL